MGQPLARFPIARTNDADEARAILAREIVDVRFKSVRNPGSFGLQMNGVRLGQTMIGYNRFDTDTVVDAGQVDDAVVFTVGAAGLPTTMVLDGEPVPCVGSGAIASPSRRVTLHRPAGGAIFIIRAGFDAIEQRLCEMIDRRPVKPIVFDRSVDLTHGVGAQVRRLLDFLVEDLQRDGAILENPLLRAGIDDALLNALLSLPSNYSDQLMEGARFSEAPWVVRRAEEFLEANATEPITISDVLVECGCGRRTLFRAFRTYRDYTPMQFLVERRLQTAREALLSPLPGDTVTSIAHASGFAHPGRFAESYRGRFGEHPSETLRKA
jgi:AraC-like DNA-binding protein